ncbi:phosphoribosylanthranilate isomerase [Desulfolucanica intricata]|uniref:phosphoribosylanthranilate isomerase n=1 Tax=Desulfolucanica intricata TaxID=1285191 RepID=UPI0008333504|nr:phosphoribosylanthranilate isomerase [Desulfolucanica intricata]
MKAGLTVKLCGMTNLEDILLAAQHGASYAGVVTEVDFSPRSLNIEQAEAIFKKSPLPTVALVYNMNFSRLAYLVKRLKPYAIQFLGLENISLLRQCKKKFPGTELWQSIHLPENEAYNMKHITDSLYDCWKAGVNLFLLDAAAAVNGVTRFGGTGKTINWKEAKKIVSVSPLPVFLAGGINPRNVQMAIQQVHPAGIDLCSGVEAFPGKKDPDKIKALMEGVKGGALY